MPALPTEAKAQPIVTGRELRCHSWRLPVILLLKPLVGQLPREVVWTVGTLLIVASIIAHDLTATPFSRWLAARHDPDTREELVPQPRRSSG